MPLYLVKFTSCSSPRRQSIVNRNTELFTLFVPCIVLQMCRRTNKMHTSYKQSLFHYFLLAVHVSDELHVQHPEHCLVNCITLLVHSCSHATARLACTNSVMRFIDSAPDVGRVVRPKHVQQVKKSEIKIVCKTCASCWFRQTQNCSRSDHCTVIKKAKKK